MELRIHPYQPGLHYVGFEIFDATDAQVRTFLEIAYLSPLAKKRHCFWQGGSYDFSRNVGKGLIHEWNYVEYLGLKNEFDEDLIELYVQLKKALKIR